LELLHANRERKKSVHIAEIQVSRFRIKKNNQSLPASLHHKYDFPELKTRRRKEIGPYREGGLMSKLLLHANCYMQKSNVIS
jgi:hypothetical protein